MLRLYGLNVSNYYNMVKLALLEKGVEFEPVKIYPGKGEEHLRRHPVGKIPAIKTEHGYLCETSVILDYLENAYPHTKSLLPESPFEQAYVKELVQIIQLYIEWPARACYTEAFFGGEVSAEVKDVTIRQLIKGIRALKQRAICSPYLAGETFSIADIVFLFSIDLASQVAKKLFDVDLLDDFDSAKKLIEKLEQRPHVISIQAEREADMDAFLTSRRESAKR